MGNMIPPKGSVAASSSLTRPHEQVSGEGIKVDSRKVEALKNWPRSTNPTEVRSFLGLAHYYQRFVEIFSSIATPLTKLIQKSATFQWTDGCEKSFQELKNRLTMAPILTLLEGPEGYVIYCDSSIVGLCGVHMQHDKLIASALRQLRSHEQKYLTHDLELATVILL
uniref:Uncharacterized mitochondrial protein AtMg00860-like n=1 Tax=Nicotiana tabacum TaxID=4097 RepID=A0A1S4C9U7_TOBAC|nr:PREDICTED: uncharacterized mitochondrial protein AtMg00860-like [Nicotiana tabacum]